MSYARWAEKPDDFEGITDPAELVKAMNDWYEHVNEEGAPRASDVYIYHSVGGFLLCELCCLNEGRGWTCVTWGDMIAHVAAHILAGDCVPNRTLPSLLEELADDPESKSIEEDGL